MASAIARLGWALCLSYGLVGAQEQRAVTADEIPLDEQTYDFSVETRCRLFAHDSCVLENENHHVLVIDGGFGTFETELDGDTVTVADLNPYTVAFDLSEEFDTSTLNEPLWQSKKPVGSASIRTIVNHGGLWVSQDQNTIWVQGGHFYHGNYWNTSSYFIPKAEIPEWELWELDINKWKSQPNNAEWNNITNDVAGHDTVQRTFAGTAASVPRKPHKFWIGGLLDSTTSPTTPNKTIQTTRQMITFDEGDRSIQAREYYDFDRINGYWQGSLIHLPIGNGSGYLISLMALMQPTTAPWEDPDGESGNIELGTEVDLKFIPIFDIDRGVWFEQEASYLEDQLPEARTRFCAVLFHDDSNDTYDLWVHGGQLKSDQELGVEYLSVLSMPSFTWSRITMTNPANNLLRSHTCHALGNQMIIVGGYPPGNIEAANATCDKEYVKIIKVEDRESTFSKFYLPGTIYRTPESVRKVSNNARVPYYNGQNPEFEADFQSVCLDGSAPPCPSSPVCPIGGESRCGSGVSAKVIAGATVGGVVGVVLIVVGIWYMRRQRHKRQAAQGASQRLPGDSPRRGGEGLQVVESENKGTATSAQVIEVGRARQVSELEGIPSPMMQMDDSVNEHGQDRGLRRSV